MEKEEEEGDYQAREGELINVLIRTSGRPNFFKKAVESVEAQTHKNWRIIVSVDDKESEEYVNKYVYKSGKDVNKYVYIRPKRRRRETGWYFNRYFNDLLAQVKEGWVVYLDDDVEIIDPLCFEKISAHMEEVNKLIFWKYQFESGKIVPEDEFWKKRPTRKHIDTGCFAHHIRYKPRWVSLRASDWRVANQLYEKIPNKVWIDEVFFRAGNNGGLGKRNDFILPT